MASLQMAANLNVRVIGGILDILLVLLGALLAIAGGFLTQRHQLKLDRAIREERLLIEIEERVRKIQADRDELATLDYDTALARVQFAREGLREEIKASYLSLERLAIQITSKKNRKIALHVLNAAREKNPREAETLLDAVLQCINPELIGSQRG